MRITKRLKPFLIPLLIFTLVSIIFLSPILKNFHYWGVADWDQFEFYNEAARKTILEYHQIPFWNPYYCGGNVMLAYPHSNVLSPSFLFVLIFGTITGLKILIFINMILGMFGMFLLSNHLKLGKFSRYLPSFVFMMSSVYALHITQGHTEYYSMSLIPFVFLFFYRSIEDKKTRLKNVLLASLFYLLMFLNGTVMPFIYLGLFLSVYSIFKSIERRNIKPLKVLFLFIIVTLFVGAIKFLPTIEFWLKSPRLVEEVTFNSIKNLYHMFLSRNQLQDSQHKSEHISAEDVDSFIEQTGLEKSRVEVVGWWEYGAYVGLIPVFLYVIGLFINFKHHKPLVLSSVVILFIMLGYGSPINIWKFLRMLPIFSSLHIPSRLNVMFVFCLSILAGLSLSRIQKSRGKENFFVFFIISIIVLDLYMVNSRILEDAFTFKPVEIEESPTFYQVEQRFNPEGPNYPYTNMFPILLENKGTVNCYEKMNLGINSEAKEDWRGKLLLDYRGEAYLVGKMGNVSITYFSPNRIKVSVNSTDEDILVLNQNYDSGWKSDKKKVESYHGLISTRVTSKDKEITFYYLPISFLVGLIVTAISVLIIIRYYSSKYTFSKPKLKHRVSSHSSTSLTTIHPSSA